MSIESGSVRLVAKRVQFQAHPDDDVALDVVVQSRSTAIFGCSCLIDALVDPSLLVSGKLELWGGAAQSALAAGKAGYAPVELPAPFSSRVETVLRASFGLLGQGKAEVQQALEKCGLLPSRKKTLGELSPLEQRLLGVAHALGGAPELLLLSRPLYRLNDVERRYVWDLLQRLDIPWIARVEANCPVSLAMRDAAEQCVATVKDAAGKAFFVHFDDDNPPPAWIIDKERLSVTATQNPQILLVEGATCQELLSWFEEQDSAAPRIFPAENGVFEQCRRDLV